MVLTLRKSLQTIENYKITNPQCNEILDILGEILIAREEYRKNMKGSLFSIDEKIIAQKMQGGLPLIDFKGGNFDLTRPREYFDLLITLAKRKMPMMPTRLKKSSREKNMTGKN